MIAFDHSAFLFLLFDLAAQTSELNCKFLKIVLDNMFWNEYTKIVMFGLYAQDF